MKDLAIMYDEDFDKNIHNTLNYFKSNFKDKNSLSEFISKLVNSDDKFYVSLYDYIISINLEVELSKPHNTNILYYLELAKIYLIKMNDKSYIKDKKDKLIQVFIEYTNYIFYILDSKNGFDKRLISQKEKNFISNVDLAINEINLGNIKKAIEWLEASSLLIEFLFIPSRYYIQRLIHENNLYYKKLSVCIIAKNEEKHIKRCLNSLKPLTDVGLAEIIVVDTGSEDNTVEIAKNYTSNVYFHEWNNDFAEARNFSISMAKSEYVFILDADEELEKETVNGIIELFTSDDYKNFSTFTFKEKNFRDENPKHYNIFTRVFIFKNEEDFCYLGSIHEQPKCKLPVKHLEFLILHYGYIMDKLVKEKKFTRNSTLLKKELSINPNNLYYIYQLITTYLTHGDREEALAQSNLLLEKIIENPFQQKFLSYYDYIAMTYIANEMYEEAINLCDIALKEQEDFIDFIFCKAEAFFIKEEYNKSLVNIKAYLELLKEFHNHELYNDVRFLFCSLDLKDKALNMALVCCYECKKYDEFMKYGFEIEDELMLKSSLRLIIECYFKSNDVNGLMNFYHKKIINSNDKNLNLVFLYFLYTKLMDLDSHSYVRTLKKLDNYKYIDVVQNFKIVINEDSKMDKATLLLNFLDIYNIDEVDIVTAKLFIYDIINLIESYKISEATPINHIKNYRKYIKFVLKRALTIKQFKGLSNETLLSLIDKYITISILMLNSNNSGLMSEEEMIFIQHFQIAIKSLERGDLLNAVKSIKNGVEVDKEMARPMELFIETFTSFKGE